MSSPQRSSIPYITVLSPLRSAIFAQVRSLVNTAQRQGISAFDAISRALTSQQTVWLLG
ncbi:MAG: hypothetical protein F6K28_52675 [Microcoleus sp. SIO2G3]|nr:hypothetical protein [Microcoleus sp. SIO2G3]